MSEFRAARTCASYWFDKKELVPFRDLHFSRHASRCRRPAEGRSTKASFFSSTPKAAYPTCCPLSGFSHIDGRCASRISSKWSARASRLSTYNSHIAREHRRCCTYATGHARMVKLKGAARGIKKGTMTCNMGTLDGRRTSTILRIITLNCSRSRCGAREAMTVGCKPTRAHGRHCAYVMLHGGKFSDSIRADFEIRVYRELISDYRCARDKLEIISVDEIISR